MAQAAVFPFIVTDPAFGEASRLPYMPITIQLQGQSLSVSALLDTGSAVNVLPYEVGLQLGAIWERQQFVSPATWRRNRRRVLTVLGTVGTLPSARLAFAWTRAPAVPVILGQVNFFMEFDVCFYRSRSLFEIKTKSAAQG